MMQIFHMKRMKAQMLQYLIQLRRRRHERHCSVQNKGKQFLTAGKRQALSKVVLKLAVITIQKIKCVLFSVRGGRALLPLGSASHLQAVGISVPVPSVHFTAYLRYAALSDYFLKIFSFADNAAIGMIQHGEKRVFHIAAVCSYRVIPVPRQGNGFKVQLVYSLNHSKTSLDDPIVIKTLAVVYRQQTKQVKKA